MSAKNRPGVNGTWSSTPEAAIASVRTGPGEKAVQETPVPHSSVWIASDNVSTKALEAE